MKIESSAQFDVRPESVANASAYGSVAEDLVRSHLALVRKLAWLVNGRATRTTEFEDLVQVGMVALIEASRTYQDQGHHFSTYATVRIRGAMVDHIRRQSPVGRSAVGASQRLGLARQRLEQMLHRAPASSEMAAELDMTAQDYFAFEQLGSRTPPASLDDDDGVAAHLADESQVGADTASEMRELVDLLTQSVATLNAREQLVLQLFFHEELNLAEIGETLGISAARVCQLKAAALGKLGNQLRMAI